MLIATLLRPGSLTAIARRPNARAVNTDRGAKHRPYNRKVSEKVQNKLDLASDANNRSSAETRMAYAWLVSAGALVKASPIIQQKGDTFRALLIILSKQSGQSRRATVA